MYGEGSLPEDSDWRSQAACKDADTEIFFPDNENDEDSVATAKNVCGQCIARLACLEFALTNNEKYGVWGGLTTKERTSIRRARARSGAAA